MAVAVANFTPDEIKWEHVGANGTIKSGKIEEFPENRANHILNKYTPRGLLRLEWNSNIDQARKSAMEIWKKFWTKQVIIFNQDNEKRRNTNREYVHPTDMLIEHAKTLGLEIVGPWMVRQTESTELAELRKENVEMRSQMQQLMGMVETLTKSLKDRNIPFEQRTAAERVVVQEGAKSEEAPAEPVPETEPNEEAKDETEDLSMDEKKLILEFQMMKKNDFGTWVMTNLDRLQSKEYPPAVLSMVKAKWEKLIQGDFPVPA